LHSNELRYQIVIKNDEVALLHYIKKCKGNQQLVTKHYYWLRKCSFTVKIRKSLEHPQFQSICVPCKHVYKRIHPSSNFFNTIVRKSTTSFPPQTVTLFLDDSNSEDFKNERKCYQNNHFGLQQIMSELLALK